LPGPEAEGPTVQTEIAADLPTGTPTCGDELPCHLPLVSRFFPAQEDRRRPDARQGNPPGDLGKKVVSPGHKRQMAGEFVSAGRCSGRQICRYFHLHRSTFHFRARQPNAWMMRLKAAVRRGSGQYSQWGSATVLASPSPIYFKVLPRFIRLTVGAAIKNNPTAPDSPYPWANLGSSTTLDLVIELPAAEEGSKSHALGYGTASENVHNGRAHDPPLCFAI